MSPAPPATFAALGTTATVVAGDERDRDTAVDIVHEHVDALDRACSRFRDDSELSRLNAAAGQPVTVSPLCFAAIEAALRAARITDGLVDPTIGGALEAAGYDADFAGLDRDGPAVTVSFRRVPGWRKVRTDRATSQVALPPGVRLDLGATAKAWCADRAARAIAETTGGGALVSLGGDVAVAGPPPDGGWAIRVSDDHAAPATGREPVVAITSGGLATSSTTVRRWRRGDRTLHHVIDPHRGEPATEHWRTVTVAAGTCLDANIASCAAIVLGPGAAPWLDGRHLPARLVEPSGRVTSVAGWPEPTGASGDRS